jgi:hypothetical protein
MAMTTKVSSVFWDVTPYSLVVFTDIPQKFQLTFSRLHNVICQRTVIFSECRHLLYNDTVCL